MQIQLQTRGHILHAQGVLFDLDGTLVESMGSIADILRVWAEHNQLDVNTVIDFSHGKRSIDIVRHFIDEAKVSVEYEALTQRFVVASDQAVAMKGANAFLQQLNELDIPWAVVSSSERVLIKARLAAAGLPLPKMMVSAEDVEQGKPSPEGYLKGAELLNLKIQDCVVFEDAPSGIQAAQQAQAQLITLGSLAKSFDVTNIDDYTQLRLK
ncbi:hypothetical protein A3K93_05460 [Acinetobacter sp. NCu2D-2]|uniref:HAD-IA family hydrolase n=1 Tax=Acinetobacter sp. NCu2D-2 TaxID=1608473 RepID=UPI0007CDC419|nr:HAD-IA family hydrolase [Acinetobacter sp. NCu2D-2]ANF81683.1 hypothetical protein A3K93_05460 [Acinetobacter sp. NCu2D-2]